MKFQLYQPLSIFEMGQRNNQEDCISPQQGCANASSRIFIVCDGMGGMEKGEVSSGIVCKTISNYLKENWSEDEVLTDTFIDKALNKAYDSLDTQEGLGSMTGTTLAMICFHRGGCIAAHIGDSRIYHIRPASQEILYRSRDHSQVQMLYEIGELSYWQMRTAPNRNVLRRAIQPQQDTREHADVIHITNIKPGDYFYLCSDGMMENMEDEELMELLSSKQINDDQKLQLLKEKTSNNIDNHSCYLVRIESVQQEESDSTLPEDETQARAANMILNDPNRLKKPGEDEPVITNEVKVLSPGFEVKDGAKAGSSENTSSHHHNKNTHSSHKSSKTHHHSKSRKKNNTWWLVLVAILILTVLLAIFFWPFSNPTPINPSHNSNNTDQLRKPRWDAGRGSQQTPANQRSVQEQRQELQAPEVSSSPCDREVQEALDNAMRRGMSRQPSSRVNTNRNNDRNNIEGLVNSAVRANNRQATNGSPESSREPELSDGLIDPLQEATQKSSKENVPNDNNKKE